MNVPALARGLGSWGLGQRRHLALALAVGGLGLLALAIVEPVRSAVEIGMDEGFEVMKALLWAKGYPLYTQVWDDQPALHTVLLGLCFKLFRPTIGTARGLAVVFGLLLWLALWLSVRRQSGSLAAYAAVVCLVVAPQVLWLSVSVMLEVPAFAVALWAFLPLLSWRSERSQIWLIVSGVFLATAMQIKLTAAIIAPALAVQIALGLGGDTWWIRTSKGARAFAIWSMSLVLVFLAWGLIFHESFDLLWTSHAAAKSSESLAFVFSPRLIWNHTEALWCGATGLVFLACRRQWRSLAIPLVWLLTAGAVALRHQPWWNYYYLHLAIPLAWLSGLGVAEALRVCWAEAPKGMLRPAFLGSLCLASALIAVVASDGGSRLAMELDQLRALPRLQDAPLVAKMRQYANETRWVYTRRAIFPFHARLLVIPELAVLPRKRFWSGRVTEERILAMLKERRPEQLLLTTEIDEPAFQRLLAEDYVLAYDDGAHHLYVAKALASK